MTKVVLFCGGRGSTTIITSLARTANVGLCVVVNAYDSGLSTGRVRRALPGLLGPSDLRKTTSTLCRAGTNVEDALLADVLEHRLPTAAESRRGRPDSLAHEELSAFVEGHLDGLAESVANVASRLPLRRWLQVREALIAFEKHIAAADTPFDYSDLAIGNAVLGGLFSQSNSFNTAVDAYQHLFDVGRHRVLNVTQGEDLWLSARTPTAFCPDEGTLVGGQLSEPISDLFLLQREAHRQVYGDRTDWIRTEQLTCDPLTREILPEINPDVELAIGEADVIVYGPGTQHSSLLPSYMTVGVAEAVAANAHAEKLYVANLSRDHDQHVDETVRHSVDKFLYFMSRRGTTSDDPGRYISTVLVGSDHADDLGERGRGITIRAARWSDPSGSHSGPAIKEEIASVVRLRSGEQLPGDSGLASIVVPVLNERERIEAALQQLRFLDLSELGLVQEIIVVDGGSTDGTLERLRGEPDIILVEAACNGRGDAIRLGLERARGEYVVTFPADNEYEPAAISAVLRELQRDPDAVILASRALGGSRAGQRLREVYADNRTLWALSHWGGVALTLLMTMRLDCVISDPLSGVRGSLRSTFRHLDNSGSGLDYDVRWVQGAIQTHRRVIEVPAGYHPRGWREGKKTSLRDGFRALVTAAAPSERK